MDAVYPLGAGSTWQDRELLFSLRALQEHVSDIDRVIIVGQRPGWLRGVVHVPATDPHACKERNIAEKVLRACRVASGPFLFLNDDHFALKPQRGATLPAWYAGELAPLAHRLRATSHYRQALLNTDEVLRAAGHATRNFDVHLPIVYDPAEFPRAMAAYDWARHRGYVVKSLYANTVGLAGTPLGDLKLSGTLPLARVVELLRPRPWFSIGPSAITLPFEELMAALYPTPSRWEVR